MIQAQNKRKNEMSLSAKTTKIINCTLEQYGASFGEDGCIHHDGKSTKVEITKKGARFYYTGNGGEIKLASTPAQPSGVEWFVESFWYWKKN